MSELQHPISSCPIDILKCIFEAAIEAPGPRGRFVSFKTAILISHVCQEWRAVALDTPTLWVNINCSMQKPLESIQEFWERSVDRVKKAPAQIWISAFHKQNDGVLPLQHCQLEKIPRIKILALRFFKARSMTEILHPSFKKPVGSLHSLQLDFEWFEKGILECTELLHQLPPITSLIVNGDSNLPISFTNSSKCSTIRHLKFDTLYNLPILSILSLFPRLEYLELIDSQTNLDYIENIKHNNPPDYEDHTTIINLPYIRQLDLLGAQECSWLKYISCPMLHTLKLSPALNSSQAFITSHQTITTLHYWSSAPHVLFKSAPQLEHLGIRISKRSAQPQSWNESPILRDECPHLISLSIDDYSTVLQSPQLEQLIRYRCLPDSHPQNDRPLHLRRLESLVVIYLSMKKLNELAWTQGTLFQEANKRLSKRDHCIDYEEWEPRSSVTLSWSE